MSEASVSEVMRQTLARRAPAVLAPSPSERAAAVLVPILVGPTVGESEILFLVRPTTMPTHAGQVAFPGGGLEPGEDATAAALREAHEELGLDPSRAEVIGRLDDVRAHTGFLVTPVVALLPGRLGPDGLGLTPSAREVEAAFTVPIARLVDPRRRRSVRGRRGSAGAEGRLHFWVDEPWVIWGLTGHILSGFLERLGAIG